MTLALLAEHAVHSVDPFLVQFSEKWGIRWYGLMYVFGFFAGYFLLLWLAKRNYTELGKEKVADFITFAAIFGVMLGGRLGFQLFYNWKDFSKDPLIFFDFLGGGMASHGGILGLVIFTWFYARRHKISWAGLGDNLVAVAPVGICLVRIANFINGELYGRLTQVSWALKFPDELRHINQGKTALFSREDLKDVAEKVSEVDPAAGNAAMEILLTEPKDRVARFDGTEPLIEASWQNDGVKNALGEFLNPRHPSQLYEAAAEGLILFIILFSIRLAFKNLYHGILTGLFFILYAVARISCEGYREPDAELHWGGLTRGQFLSTFMILIGAAFIVWGLRTKRRNRAVK